MPRWTHSVGLTRDSLITSARTSLASVISLLLARLLKLPEFYWAPVSTVVILLSTTNPLTLAWQRFAGTALGAIVGAVIATYTRQYWPARDWIIYGLGIFLCGIISSMLRHSAAYRFAGITLTIILLVPHTRPGWIVATHRFIEVSLGIAVALLVALIWPLPAIHET